MITNSHIKSFYSLFAILFLYLLTPLTLHAQPILVTAQTKNLNIKSYLEYIEDPEKTLSFERLLNLEQPLNWKPTSAFKETINLGYTQSAYWFRFQIQNRSPEHLKPNIVIGYPVLDFIEFFIVHPEKEIELLTLGDKLPFNHRPVNHRNFVIPIHLEPEDQVTYYLRVETSSSMQLPIEVVSDAYLLERAEFEMLWLGLYFGTMLVMVFYNLFVYFSVRETSYLYYVLYVACITLFLASLNGVSYQYLWPNSTWWNDQSIVFFLAFVVFFATLFIMRFLDIETYFPKFKPIGSGLILVSILLVLATIFVPYGTIIIPVIGWASTAIIVVFFAGLVCWLRGDSAATFYLIAWIALFAGGLILALNKFDLLERNFFTENSALIGSALEVILLSLALADRLNGEKRKRFEAQIRALENERVARMAQAEALQQEKNARGAQEKALNHEREAREAQAKALDIQRQATENLEMKIRKRTQELEIANNKLEQLTFTDGLTEIRNRRFLDQCLEREFNRACREKSPLAILLIDIDHFKQFNDTYGHLAGDDCLKMVAQTINDCALRENDVVARFGGEEFCAILPNTDQMGAMQVAEEIRQAVSQSYLNRNNESLNVTVSVGATSLIPERTHSLSMLLDATDKALYLSKSTGRNKVSFALPPL